MAQRQAIPKYVILAISGCSLVGKALGWGSRDRRFKSSHPDHGLISSPLGEIVRPCLVYGWSLRSIEIGGENSPWLFARESTLES